MSVIHTDSALSMESANQEDHPSQSNDPTPNPNHHTAFMQCRACCNCDSGCSYYGKGKFDAEGNFIGS